jgi:hypothetical protein
MARGPLTSNGSIGKASLAVIGLVTSEDVVVPAYLLTAAGLQSLEEPAVRPRIQLGLWVNRISGPRLCNSPSG